MKSYWQALVVLLILHACAEKTNQTDEEPATLIYKRDRVFTFVANHFNEKGALMQQDTILLTTSGEIFNETYGQTKSTWEIASRTGFKEKTGITEHDTAVWLHPPRAKVYRKLELSPFPMVQFPLETGHSWSWPLLVGNHYIVKGHAEWGDEPELFVSHYRVAGEITLPTELGELDCYKIESYTESNFARTELTAFFNQKFGFVKFEYANIDSSRLTMEILAARDIHTIPIYPGTNLVGQ